MMKSKILMFSLLVFSYQAFAAELTGYKNFPAGWRTEVIPFPLDFAPEIKLSGVEELLFSPGMYQAESEAFFSYVFVWIVKEESLSMDQLKQYLKAYYLGLYKAVAQQPTGQVSVAIEQHAGTWPYRGTISWIEPFVTKKAQVIHFKAKLQHCQRTAEKRWYFMVSPQDDTHEIWIDLKSLQTTSC